MRRRALLAAVALMPLAGCDSSSGATFQAVQRDNGHAWVSPDGPLGRGFCLTLVRGRRVSAVLKLIGGTSLLVVPWVQLVGPGDGELNGGRYFLGITGLGRWTLLLEDGDGGLGMDTEIAGPLSARTDVVVYRGDASGRGTRRTYKNGKINEDVTDHTETAITHIEGQIGMRLTGALLERKKYSLVTVPKV
ncbi:DUF6461 domain-containing protein [Actinoplanes sp. HUAS TT8]|uniref:DUF6461 domain-containing protein n=1 Tax=Actinoplanes sp. HUAS TT8 TaxID=3447453 RepID=UPI003F521432